MNDDVVPENPDLGVSCDLAVLDHAARDGAHGADLIGHADLGVADDHFLKLGRQHTLHGGLNFIDGIVDHPVVADVHVGTLDGCLGTGIGTDIEAHDDGTGGGGQQHVAFVDGAHAGMDHPDPDLFVGDLFQAGLHGFGGALHVGLDNQGQLLHFTLLHPGEQVVQGHLLLQLGGRVLGGLTALLHQLPGHALVGDHIELVAGGGNVRKAGDLNGLAGTGGLYGAALVVGHHTDTAHGGAGDEDVALLQGAVLHQQGGNGASGLVQTGLDDSALAPAVGVGLQLLNLGGQGDHLQQILQTHAGLGGDGADHRIAAPLLGDQLILGELLLDPVRVGGGLIHLVDGNNDGHLGGLGVVDGLNGLGHDAVVGSHHQNGNIGTHGAAGTHGGKGSVARGIQEGDGLTVYVHGVGADVLGDAAGLPRGDGGLADGVQQGGLAVVNVTHDHHNGGPGFQLVGGVHMIVDDLLLDGDGNFLLHLAAHFGGHILRGIVVDGLVDTGHDAVFHQQLDHFTGGLLHPGGQLAYGDLVGNLYGEGCLPGNLHLQAAHFLLLLVAGLVAPELVVLFVLLLALLAADALLTALVILHTLGNQSIHPVIKTGGIHLHGRGIHHPALPLAFRLPGLFGLGGNRSVSLGGSGVFRLGLLGLGLGLLDSLGRFRLGLGLNGKHLLQRIDGMTLGHHVKHQVQLLIRQNLGVGLGLFPERADDVADLLCRDAEIRRHFL